MGHRQIQIGAAAGVCAVVAGTAIGVLAIYGGSDSGLNAKTEPTEIDTDHAGGTVRTRGPQRFAERHRARRDPRGTGRSRLYRVDWVMGRSSVDEGWLVVSRERPRSGGRA